MTDKEILEKAISIAIANGFEYKHENDERHEAIFYCDAYECLIFDHNFAKALCGESKRMKNLKYADGLGSCPHCGDYLGDSWNWEYYLQELVLQKNRLKYIEQFLKKGEID